MALSSSGSQAGRSGRSGYRGGAFGTGGVGMSFLFGFGFSMDGRSSSPSLLTRRSHSSPARDRCRISNFRSSTIVTTATRTTSRIKVTKSSPVVQA